MGHSIKTEKKSKPEEKPEEKKEEKKTDSTPKPGDETAEVLYQKIGDRWYAYSVVNDDVFMGPIPEATLDDIHNLEGDEKN